MKKVVIIFILFTIGCAAKINHPLTKNSDTPHPIPPTTPIPPHPNLSPSFKFWGGDSTSYCLLKENIIPLDTPESNSDLEKMADELAEKHKLQEAIWLYQLNPHTLPKAHELTTRLQKILRQGNFTEIQSSLKGYSPKKVLQFENGIRGIFKMYADTDHPKTEAAAYKLDQLLHIGVVPMTVLRKIGDKLGSIQYFMTDVTEGNGDQAALTRNFRTLKLFDYLTGNPDRRVDNFLIWKTQNYMIAIDNGEVFNDNTCGDISEIKLIVQHDPRLMQIIDKLSDASIHSALTKLIQPKFLTKLIERIHAIQSLENITPEEIPW